MLQRLRLPGGIVITTYTKTDTTEKAIDMALDVLKQLGEKGITAEQLASVKAYIKGTFPTQQLETTDQLSNVLADMELYGLGKEEIDDFFSRIDSASLDDINATARKYYKPDHLTFVLLGNAAKIRQVAAKYAPKVTEVSVNKRVSARSSNCAGRYLIRSALRHSIVASRSGVRSRRYRYNHSRRRSKHCHIQSAGCAIIAPSSSQPDPYRLIRIGSLENNGMTVAVPSPLLDALHQEPLLEGVCGVQTPLSTVTLSDATFPVGAHALSGDCYRMLGVHAVLGRLLTSADDVPSAPSVAVLSHGFWQDKFAGSPNALWPDDTYRGCPFHHRWRHRATLFMACFLDFRPESRIQSRRWTDSGLTPQGFIGPMYSRG